MAIPDTSIETHLPALCAITILLVFAGVADDTLASNLTQHQRKSPGGEPPGLLKRRRSA
jgi:hypothetical protein